MDPITEQEGNKSPPPSPLLANGIGVGLSVLESPIDLKVTHVDPIRYGGGAI